MASASRSSKRLREKNEARKNAAANVVVESIESTSGEETGVPGGDGAVVVPTQCEEVDVTSRDDTSGIKVTITKSKSSRKRKGINIFHEQFAGIQQYPLLMLKIFAKEELHQVRNVWDEAKKQDMCKALTKAIPDMSSVYGKAKWPVPVGFTPSQVAKTYSLFLEFFLDKYQDPESSRSDSEVNDEEDQEGPRRVEGKLSSDDAAPEFEAKEGDATEKSLLGAARKSYESNDEGVVSDSGESDYTSMPRKYQKKRRKRSLSRKKMKSKKRRSKRRSRGKWKRSRQVSSSSSASGISSGDTPSSSTSLSPSSSSSSESPSSDESSEEDTHRRRRKKAHSKKAKRKRKRSSRKRRKSSKRHRKGKGKRNKKKAFAERVQAVEYSQSVGQDKYSKEHLYSCREMLKGYRVWANPQSRGDQKATVPKVVRQFIARYLADEDTKILEAYDLPHVKKSQGERKHVTFLMNKMGGLAAKVAKARLERARMALDKHNRLIESAKLSKKERQESIKSECAWAGQIRWLSELVSKGESSFYKAKEELAESKRVDNFRCAHPDVSESEARKIVRKIGENEVEQRPKSSNSGFRVPSRSRDTVKEINDLKSKLGILRKKQSAMGNSNGHREGGNKKPGVRFEFECWHCKSKNHPIAKCPVAKAGKPPVKGSFFWKKQNEDKSGQAEGRQ